MIVIEYWPAGVPEVPAGLPGVPVEDWVEEELSDPPQLTNVASRRIASALGTTLLSGDPQIKTVSREAIAKATIIVA